MNKKLLIQFAVTVAAGVAAGLIVTKATKPKAADKAGD